MKHRISHNEKLKDMFMLLSFSLWEIKLVCKQKTSTTIYLNNVVLNVFYAQVS